MAYRIDGLDPAAFASLAGLDEVELRAKNIRGYVADANPGFPCRVTLEDAEPGERMLLLNHQSRGDGTPYRASHAIFVREKATVPARFVDEVPPVMRTRRLSLRGFDAEGMMVDALLTEPGEADAGLRRLFDNPIIVEVDAHNAVRGCFAARARRA